MKNTPSGSRVDTWIFCQIFEKKYCDVKFHEKYAHWKPSGHLNFSSDFRKKKYCDLKLHEKCVHLKPSRSMRTDKQRDWHDELNNCFVKTICFRDRISCRPQANNKANRLLSWLRLVKLFCLTFWTRTRVSFCFRNAVLLFLTRHHRPCT
jgi:hypothetical protein